MRRKLLRLRKKVVRGHKRSIRRFKIFSRHPFAVPVATILVLAAITGGVYLLFGRASADVHPAVVIIRDSGKTQTVPSLEPTVGTLLDKLNIQLHQGDVVEPAPATRITQDEFRINIYRAKPVEIVDGGHTTFAYSAGTTPRSVATQVGLTVYPEDDITTQPVTNFVTSSAVTDQVIIDRATPVNVNLYGANITMRTHAKTLGDLVKEKRIHLAKDDTVTPALNTPLTANQQVYIDRHGIRVETITQDIPMPVQTIQDPSLAFGTSAVRQQGAPGKQTVTYQVQLQNGVEVGRTQLQSVVSQQPVTQIVVQGTSLSGIKGDMALAGIGAGDYNAADYIISHESGWCPTKAQGEHDCPVTPDNQYTSGGYGLCQATPGSKMSSFGSDWATNPITQLKWCNNYAVSRYGGWQAAYSHWLSYHNW